MPEPAGGSVRLAAQANETVRRVRPRLDLIAPRGVATRADETPDRLMLDLMPGRELRATRTSLATTSGGSVIWSGAADDDPGSLVTLTVNGDVMVGEVYLTNGEHFRVDVGDQGDALIRAAAWPFASGDDTKAPTAALVVPAADPAAGAVELPPAAADDGTTVDVLVVYTPGARDREGGEASIRAKIDTAIAGSNDAYARSQIVQRLRLVHVEEIAYADSGNDDTDLTRLQATSDGFLDGVHALRNQYAADLVLLVTRSTGTGFFSGLAYVMSSLSTNFAPWSFAVCTSPLTFLFAHEMAHTMGAGHGDSAGLFSYSRGFTDQRTFQTLMGGQVPCSSCTRLLQLSSPNLLYQGVATGVPDVHDNARTLNASAQYVAKFRLSGALDGDADALPTSWEIDYGLNPNSSTGDDGASGDPDRDGRTNAQELAAGTHPRGFNTRYFAEGATSAFFDTRIALANPSTTSAIALLRYLKSDGSVVAERVVVPPRARRTVQPKNLLGTADFSTIVESDERVLVDRTMTWDARGFGSHAETAVTAPSTTWYFAEGATHSGLELFYLLQNPGSTAAQVEIRYLLPGGSPLAKNYAVAANSRLTIWVDQESFGAQGTALAATDVSAVITSTNNVPIIAERAMYLSTDRAFKAGHESAGVTQPRTAWFLAEGATGPYFDEFLLIANPNAQAAQVRVTYLLPAGSSLVKTYTVGANSRFNIWVDEESFAGVKQLANTAVSAIVESTNGVGIIAERAMWWPGSSATWQESHNSAGSATAGPRWGLADGEVGGANATETYVLIANTSSFAGSARVTLLFEDGTAPLERTYALSASSRTNVNVASDFPAAAGKRFGTIVESLGASPAQIVVERAMYSDAEGVHWAAGTHVVAAPLP
ncbi:MAG: M12 family metallo-peptidase [Vicinamibacterales bacterium]